MAAFAQECWKVGWMDEGIVSVNTAIDLITEEKSCEGIIKELMADYIN